MTSKHEVLRGGLETTKKLFQMFSSEDAVVLADELGVEPANMKSLHAGLTSDDKAVAQNASDLLASIALVELLKRAPRLRTKFSGVAI
jgi:hypothetical protein